MATDATTSQTALSEKAMASVSDDLRAGKALMIGAVYVIVQLFVGALVGIVAVICYTVANGGQPPRGKQELMTVTVLPAGVIALLVGGIAVFVVTAIVLRRTEGGLRSIGWCPAASRDVWVSAVAGVLTTIVFLVLVWLFPPADGQTMGPIATAVANGGWLMKSLWAAAALLPPPIEECLCRGVLWTGLKRSFGGVAAAVTVTVLFVGSHATEALNYWPTWLAISLVGVGTLVQRSRTGSLIPPLALHGAYNISLVFTVYLVAALSAPPTVEDSRTGRDTSEGSSSWGPRLTAEVLLGAVDESRPMPRPPRDSGSKSSDCRGSDAPRSFGGVWVGVRLPIL
jgi:membrane protease YdiL (CAAX protease family)